MFTLTQHWLSRYATKHLGYSQWSYSARQKSAAALIDVMMVFMMLGWIFK